MKNKKYQCVYIYRLEDDSMGLGMISTEYTPPIKLKDIEKEIYKDLSKTMQYEICDVTLLHISELSPDFIF